MRYDIIIIFSVIIVTHTVHAIPLKVSLGSLNALRVFYRHQEHAYNVFFTQLKSHSYVGGRYHYGSRWRSIIGSRFNHTTIDGLYTHALLPISYYGIQMSTFPMRYQVDYHENTLHGFIDWKQRLFFSGYIENTEEATYRLAALTVVPWKIHSKTITLTGYHGTFTNQACHGLRAFLRYPFKGLFSLKYTLETTYEQWWVSQAPTIQSTVHYISVFDRLANHTRFQPEGRLLITVNAETTHKSNHWYASLSWMTTPNENFAKAGCYIPLTPSMGYQLQIEGGSQDTFTLLAVFHLMTRISA